MYDNGQLYNEDGEIVYTYQNNGAIFPDIDLFKGDELIGQVRWRASLLHSYDLSYRGEAIGTLDQEFSLTANRLYIDSLGWEVEGNFLAYRFDIYNEEKLLATLDKELFRMSHHYYIDILDEDYEELLILIIIAINQFNRGC